MAAAAIPRDRITGLVLAGGLGRRMGGADKGLLDWRGRPLAAHAIERLAPQVGSVAVSANRNAAAYAAFGVPVWPDLPAAAADGPGPSAPDAPQTPIPAAQPTPPVAPGAEDAGFVSLGPLAGILSGMRRAGTPWLAVVPCDTPAFPADLVERLAAGRGDAPIAYARAGRTHPVFCLVATSLADALAQALAGGERRVRVWLDAHGAVPVDFDDESAFANLNTPENLDAA